jgi:hypothetical protein
MAAPSFAFRIFSSCLLTNHTTLNSIFRAAMAKEKKCETTPAAISLTILDVPKHPSDTTIKAWQWLMIFFLVFFLCDGDIK